MKSYRLMKIFNSTLPISGRSNPIIVAGMPKSGTTVIANLLGQAIGERISSDPFHRLDEKGIDFRSALFRGDISIKNIWRKHRRIFDGGVVKDPNFPFFLDELIELFPESKIVFTVREPKQNIRSILDRVKLHNTGSFQEISSDLPTGWKNLLKGTSPEMPGSDYLEKMAWRWRKSAEMYQNNKDRITLVRYEDFNRDKIKYIESLANNLGYDVINDVSKEIDFQFQPKGQLISDWKNYYGGDGLERIKKIVNPIASEFGYE